MRVQVVLVCLVLLAVLASLSDASLISASGRRRARSILQPSAQAVLRNQVQAKHGSNFAASSSTSVTDLVSDAEKALLVARVNVDKAFEAARAAQLERGAKRNAIIAFADNDLKVAKRAVIDAQLDLEASRRIQQAQVNAKAEQDPNVIAARKAFESARAKKVMQPSNKALVADFEATKQRWTLAVIAARVAIRFPAAAPKPAPVPAAPAKTAYAPAQQKTAAVPNAGKTGLPAGASPSSAAAAAPASGSAAAGTASATAAADPYAESLRNQRANNPLNQMHGGIEYVASELDQGMRASMIKDGMNPDGPVGVTCRAIPNFFWRAITSVGTAIGKISLSSHNAAEASHAGKSGSSIAKTFVTEAGPAAVQLAVTGASLGAAAGAESAVGYLVQTTQGLATEAGTKLIVQALPANSGAATAVSAISAAASNSLLSLSSSAGAGTAASEVLALTNKFKTSGFARVSLALLLSTYRGVNLGADVNAALNQIGLPPTPQSPVDVARTFIRVKYSSGTITVDEWKLAESMLDVPRFQKVVGDAFERAARMSSDALKATPKK